MEEPTRIKLRFGREVTIEASHASQFQHRWIASLPLSVVFDAVDAEEARETALAKLSEALERALADVRLV